MPAVHVQSPNVNHAKFRVVVEGLDPLIPRTLRRVVAAEFDDFGEAEMFRRSLANVILPTGE